MYLIFKRLKIENWTRLSRRYARIQVTSQFFEAIDPKINILDMLKGSVCTEFQVSIVFSLVREPGTNRQTNT